MFLDLLLSSPPFLKRRGLGCSLVECLSSIQKAWVPPTSESVRPSPPKKKRKTTHTQSLAKAQVEGVQLSCAAASGMNEDVVTPESLV